MKVLKRNILFLLMFFVLSFNTLVVNAEYSTPDGVLVISADTYGKILSTVNKAHKTIDTYYIVNFQQQNDGTYIMSFNASKYDELSYDEREDFMGVLLGETANNASLTPIIKNKVYNFFETQDTEIASALRYLKEDINADFVEAKKWFEPFSGPISTFLGFGCIIIFSGLALSVVFDIIYLTIPVVQPLLERGEEHRRPWGVSNEAWKVHKELEDPSNKKSMMGLYCRRRIPVFITTALILAWLISGKIYDIVVYFLDWFNIL